MKIISLCVLLLSVISANCLVPLYDSVRPPKCCYIDGECRRPGKSFPDKFGCKTCRVDIKCRVICSKNACPGCTLFNKIYNIGETFQHPLDCNMCSCTLDGQGNTQIICTKIYCPKPHCIVDGIIRYPGHIFDDEDCCRKCICTDKSKIHCFDVPPPPVPQKPHKPGSCFFEGECREQGSTFPDKLGCNNCTADENCDVACTEKACIGCVIVNRFFEIGESFEHPLDCNNCRCVLGNAGPVAVCERKFCPKVHCIHEGIIRYPGEIFDSTDCCRECTCTAKGKVECSGVGLLSRGPCCKRCGPVFAHH